MQSTHYPRRGGGLVFLRVCILGIKIKIRIFSVQKRISISDAADMEPELNAPETFHNAPFPLKDIIIGFAQRHRF